MLLRDVKVIAALHVFATRSSPLGIQVNKVFLDERAGLLIEKNRVTREILGHLDRLLQQTVLIGFVGRILMGKVPRGILQLLGHRSYHEKMRFLASAVLAVLLLGACDISYPQTPEEVPDTVFFRFECRWLATPVLAGILELPVEQLRGKSPEYYTGSVKCDNPDTPGMTCRFVEVIQSRDAGVITPSGD